MNGENRTITKMMKQPFVSFCILSYNHGDFILDALQGAVNQEYDNFEIVISDDASTDNTSQVIKEFINQYEGPIQIKYNVNEKNLGLAANFNKVACEIAQGEYLILAAGDDVSLPNRIKLSIELLKKNNVESGALGFRYVDKSLIEIKDRPDYGQDIQKYGYDEYVSGIPRPACGPSRIISKKILSMFGPILPDCPTEDTTLSFRAMMYGNMAFASTPVVLYRQHENNISSESNLYTNLNPQYIYNQYRKDLDCAYEKHLITTYQYEQLDKRIRQYLLKEKTIRLFYSNKCIFKRIIASVEFLFNRTVPINKENLRFLLQLFRRFPIVHESH